MAGLARHPRSEAAGLLRHLDRLVGEYGAARVASDPVSLVRRYDDPRDREVAGLVAAGLAFGGVATVLRSASAVLDLLGPRPAEGLRRRDLERRLSGFRHRWVAGRDVALLLRAVADVLATEGSLEACFLAGGVPDRGGMGAAIDSFSRRLKARAGAAPAPRGFDYLLPEPGRGGAAKRLCLFLRWMARPEDGVDLGVWTGLPPSALVIPLDTHVLRIARYVGLTARRTSGWRTALDVTESLAALRPEDPVRYDFAIAQLGISRGCLHRRVPERCGACALDAICRLP